MRQERLGTLTKLGKPAVAIECSFSVQSYSRLFPRPQAGLLNKKCPAHAIQMPLLACFCLASWKVCPLHVLFSDGKHAAVVTTVEYDILTKPTCADSIRHLLRLDKVPVADNGRIEVQCFCHSLNQALTYKGSFVPARSAVRPHRRLIGDDHVRDQLKSRPVIWTWQHGLCQFRYRDAMRSDVGPGVYPDLILQPQ